nr:hypothetical protein [Streptomyces sp. SKN60]
MSRKCIAGIMRERDIRGSPGRKHRLLDRPDEKARPAELVVDAAAESFWAVLDEEIGTRTRPDRVTAFGYSRPRPGSAVNAPSRSTHHVLKFTGSLGRPPSACRIGIIIQAVHVS